MSSSAVAAGAGRKASHTFYAEGLCEVLSLLVLPKRGCVVEVTRVSVHEVAAVVEVLSRAARADGMVWANPKLNNLRRLRDLSAKLQVVIDGLLVLLEEDPTNTGAARELWKYGWALRRGADHLQGKGAKKFRSVGNLLIRHADHVDDERKTAEWLRARLPDLREHVTKLQTMSVSVPLDKFGAVDFDSDQDTGDDGSGNKGTGGGGSGNKGKDGGGSGNKGKGGSGNKGKGVSGSGENGGSGKGDSGGTGNKRSGNGGGSGIKRSVMGGGSDKGKGISGSGENGVPGKGGSGGSGGAPVKKKRYVKKGSGKGVSGSGKGVSGEA